MDHMLLGNEFHIKFKLCLLLATKMTGHRILYTNLSQLFKKKSQVHAKVNNEHCCNESVQSVVSVGNVMLGTSNSPASSTQLVW